MIKTRNSLKGFLFTIIMLVVMLAIFTITASAENHEHDMVNATCTEPATCKICEYTEGYALTHSWADSTEFSDKRVCTVCGAINFPDFEFVTRYYETVEESGFDVEEILNLFPREIEAKYENGKYMIKDVGSEYAEYYDGVDFARTPMTLENGYWTIEISKDRYDTVMEDDESLWVNFHTEGYFWQVEYKNGHIWHNIQLATPGNVEVVLIYTDMDLIEFSFPIGDKFYINTYINGVISAQRIIVYLENNDCFYIDYSSEGTLEQVNLYSPSTGKFLYYVVGYGWSETPSFDPEYTYSGPSSYENADEEFFKAMAPTTIGCTHQEYSEVSCQSPETCILCGHIKEGSVPLEHDMSNATCTEPSICKYGCGYIEYDYLEHDMSKATCTEPSICKYGCGYTEGAPLGHDMANATCTEPSTCNECGYTEGNSLGHDMANATCTEPSTCNECGYTEGNSLGHDMADATCSEPPICNECGYTEGNSLGHDMADATCTEPPICNECGYTEGNSLDHNMVTDEAKAPTCTETGLTEGAHCTRCDEATTAQESIPAKGHSYDNACDDECNVCKEVRIPNEHVDTDKNYLCDECNAELPKDGLSGGTIALISVGSAAVVIIGGFSLFWFVIKKKKWSDLFHK